MIATKAFNDRELSEDRLSRNNLNRWYDAKVGRWISEDPIGFGGGDANLYRYVGNGPTNATDPSGLQKDTLSYNVKAHVTDVKLKITIEYGLNRGTNAYSKEIGIGDLLRDPLIGLGKNLFKNLIKRLHDRIGELIDFVDSIKVPLGKQRHAFENIFVYSWNVRPVYTVKYEALCVGGPKGRIGDTKSGEYDDLEGRTLASGRPSSSGGDFWNAGTAVGRRRIGNSLKDGFKTAARKINRSRLLQDARGLLDRRLAADYKPDKFRVVEIGGLGKDPPRMD